MKVTGLEVLRCDAGWRNYYFLKLSTDGGIIGWSEFDEGFGSPGITAVIERLAPRVVGQKVFDHERIHAELYCITRPAAGGVVAEGLGAIENALLDAKAKALGVPCHVLLGGKIRDRVRVYWSHCATWRINHPSYFKPAIIDLDGVRQIGAEAKERGFTALKTNMVIPGDPATVYFPGFGSGINTTDGAPSVEILDAIDRLIGTFRAAVGPKVGLCLDLNYNFRTEGVLRIAKLLERYDMQWLEYDNWDPEALLQIKQSTSTRLASCESLVTLRQYRPFLERHAVDVAIIDVPWNGFSQAVLIGRLAEACEINIAPHNYYSHLADLHSLHLCAVLPNVRIMEIDVDDVPWKGPLVTRPPLIRDGHIWLTDAPGWGADIDERVLRLHPWPRPGAGDAGLFYGMDPGQMAARPE
ncbi:MAG: mandelate racemase/muconate lactonizing enzyme family protein [Candidatus Rokuibacteriota bacterium]|nr:MAG: mandelate racemase/muconate lactonizing enzyme family protein [Candidatus Rokubacteria bacterium]